MSTLAPLNNDSPPELLYPGILKGRSIEADLDNIQEHVTSRSAEILKTRSSKYGLIAIKVVFQHDVREPHNLRKEAKLLAQMDHPNVCKLLNAYIISSTYVLVLPYYPLCLRDLLGLSTFTPSAGPAFSIVAKSLAYQMCQAVAYLESSQVAHRDISPSNWMISQTGEVVLIDFGVAWSAVEPGAEGTANLHFELGTGAYRPPEFLFGSKAYNPFASDLWSLGAALAGFFTFIGPEQPSSPRSPGSSPPTPWYIAPIKRSNLFEGGSSDFALIGSIFKTLGTPTLETWPEAAELPDFGKFTYRSFPRKELSEVLPNLPSFTSSQGAAQLLEAFLQYPFGGRLKAGEALQHPWFHEDEVPLLLPRTNSLYLDKSIETWLSTWS